MAYFCYPASLFERVFAMRSANIPLPKHWPQLVKTAIPHIISLAHLSITYSRSWCANSSMARVRLASEADQARQNVALLTEEMSIKDSRLASISPHMRPLYTPQERYAILLLKAARTWSIAQTARHFLIEPDTIASWIKRLNEDGPNALVQPDEPTNKFPDAAWFPFALPQCFPFCWWVALVLGHFSRAIVGFAVFPAQPSSADITALHRKSHHQGRRCTQIPRLRQGHAILLQRLQGMG